MQLCCEGNFHPISQKEKKKRKGNYVKNCLISVQEVSEITNMSKLRTLLRNDRHVLGVLVSYTGHGIMLEMSMLHSSFKVSKNEIFLTALLLVQKKACC